MNALGMNASPFLAWLLKTTLQGSLLVCLILLIKLVLRNRLPARWHYVLWLVLLVRLSLPWAPQSRLSVYNLFEKPQWTRLARMVPRDVPAVTLEADNETAPDVSREKSRAAAPAENANGQRTETTIPASESPSPVAPVRTLPVPIESSKARWRLLSPRVTLPVLWFIGAVVFAGYVLIRNVGLWRSIKRERPVTDQQILDALEDSKMQMGVQTIVGLVVTDRIKSPALFGFIRPRILLPEGLLEALSVDELQYVFLHELAHLKRRDIYLGWLVSLLQILHWFNPLIWLAFRRMRADQEMACDALALSRMTAEEPPAYGRTIVNLLERFSQPHYVPSVAGILEEPTHIERRMTMIAKFKSNSYRWSPLAFILIVLLACVSLPEARRTKATGVPTTPPSGIVVRQVWAEAADPDFMGAPSPDGKYLSYVDWETGDLAVRDLATGTNRKLTSEGWDKGWAQHSVFSPDSKQLAYYWWNSEKGEEEGAELRIVGLDGSGPRVVPLDKGTYLRMPAAWSADGKQILALGSGKDRSVQILLIPVVDGKMRVLKTIPRHPGLWRYPSMRKKVGMSLSPDGRYVAYTYPAKQDSWECDIFLLAVDGSGETVRVEHPADDFVLGWAPDGRRVVFASDRAGSMGVWAIEVADGKPQGTPHLLKPDVGLFHPMGFAPNGSYYYGVASGGNNIYVATYDPQRVDVTGEPVLAIKQYEGSNWAPDWSPDGRYLACVSKRPGAGWVFLIQSVETGQVRELSADLEEFDVHSLRWFPDGRSLLGIGRAKDSPPGGILRIDVETGKATTIVTTIVRGGQFPNVTSDGRTMFSVSRGHNGWWIWRHDLTTGEKEPVFRAKVGEHGVGAILGLALSPDEKYLAFQDLDAGMLKVISVAGGQPRELAKVEGKITIAWTPDGNHLLYAKRLGKSPSQLWRISAEGGEPQKLDLTMPLEHIRFHPDGRRIAFTAQDGTDRIEVWAIENLLPGALITEHEPATTVRKTEYEWRGPFANMSPNGKYICDRDWDTGTLVVHELATGKSRTLVGHDSYEDGSPLVSAISHDSKEVAYLWYEPNTKASSLHVVGFDGSGHRVLCKGRYPTPRDWSADGQKILAVVLENDIWQMVWISATDGSIQHITSMSRGYPGTLDLSPDGRFIAYDHPQAENTSKRDVFVFNLSENRELSVTQHPADDKLLGWTPNGRHIFFASDRTGTWDAWLLQIAGGKPQGFPELVKHGIGDIAPIGFTPQGSYYYGHEQTLEDVLIARLDLETGEVLSEPMPVLQTGSTNCHDWSPDGQYLAYCERRPDKSQTIHIRTLATGRERTLSDNLPYIRWLRWSPDNRSLLIDGYKRGDSRGAIFQIDARTGERTDLVRSPTEILMRPEMSPDGKTLFYIRGNDPRSGTVRLMARDLKSGHEKELFRVVPPARLMGSVLSPDGQRIVLSIVPRQIGPEGPVLKTLSTVDGQLRELLQFEKSEKLRAVGVTWMPDSRNVLFWKWFQGDKELELYRVSAEGGEPRKLWSRKALGHMRVHPDGQRIAFYDRSTTRGVWVMENFLPKAVAAAGE